jgi:hypothetical protein
MNFQHAHTIGHQLVCAGQQSLTPLGEEGKRKANNPILSWSCKRRVVTRIIKNFSVTCISGGDPETQFAQSKIAFLILYVRMH